MKNNEDIFRDLGLEIEICEGSSFSIIIETLSRIGITSRNKKTLTQTCHILHKRGRYAIMHFKELFVLDNKNSTLSNEDIARRNLIAKLLQDWGLVKIIDSFDESEDEIANINKIKIIPHSEKNNWELVTKYTIGNKKQKIAQ